MRLSLAHVPSRPMVIAPRLFDLPRVVDPQTPPGWPDDLPPELYEGWDMEPMPACPLCAQRNLFGRVTCGPGADSHCARRVAAAFRLAGFHLHEQSEWLGYCADIVLPVPRIVVEYDGEPWHRDKPGRDEEQRHLAAAKGFLMIRLREPGLPHLSPDDLNLSVPFGRWSRTVVRDAIVAGVSRAAERRCRPE